MKIPTQDLTGAALDWAVAKAAEQDPEVALRHRWSPSTQWEQAGPLIENARISVVQVNDEWLATQHVCAFQRDQDGETCTALYDWDGNRRLSWYGSTPLIAAMRCIVGSKLGDQIDVPDTRV